MVLEGLLDVEQVNHDRSDGNDALIDSCRGPRCPASLRGTSDYKPVDIDPAPHSAAAEGRDRIHGPHHALGHRERSEEHTSELQSRGHLVCRLLLEKKKK